VGVLERITGWLENLQPWKQKDSVPFTDLFVRFHQIMQENNAALELIADMEDKLGGEFVFDRKYLTDNVQKIEDILRRSAYNFNFITDNRYLEINAVIEDIVKRLQMELAGQIVIPKGKTILALGEIAEVMDDAVGNKAYNLSRIVNLPQAKVPPGFVVTIGGFRKYLAYNNLFDQIEALLKDGFRDEHSLESVSQQCRLLILGGDIPPELRREILVAAEEICEGRPEDCYFSVRSSAVGEDGELSFAGLHESYLNVPFRELLSSFKKVLASLYSPGGLKYRFARQMPPNDLAMAVLYQLMVPSRVAGVAYTLDPNNPQQEVCLIASSWGLGKVVVEGSGEVDTYRISRRSPHTILDQRTGSKERMVAPFETGPSREVSPELRDTPSLKPEEAAEVVETALILERYFKRPLDIEWSLDQEGQLWALQARPLGLSGTRGSRSAELKGLLKQYPALLDKRGVIAYRGIGAGQVWVADDIQDLENFPNGAVLVSHFAMPWLAKALPRASAVITDMGSPISHMATVAREFRVPTIVDTGLATSVLKPGQEVTVDAERNVVYQGRINELLHYQLLEKAPFEATFEFRLLRRALKHIAPLSLINPEASNFTAKGCQTFHDVLRFIHEKSVRTLVQVGADPHSLLRRGGKRLRTDIPLNLILIDIGGGLAKDVGKSEWVLPEQIASRPMKALWRGMGSPTGWNTDPIAVDFQGLMSSVTRTQASQISGQVMTGLNLAVLGADYLNLSLRVGYHFTVVDASIGPQQENNNIYFRFFGGATSLDRRSRRANLLHSILEKVGFKIEGQGELVLARATNLTVEQVYNYMNLIGRLIGFARQLDVLLIDDSTVAVYFEKFVNENNLDNSHPGG